jgi:hypothetical protein
MWYVKLNFLHSVRWTPLCTTDPELSPFNFPRISVLYGPGGSPLDLLKISVHYRPCVFNFLKISVPYRLRAFSIQFAEHLCVLKALSFLHSISWAFLCTIELMLSPFNFLNISVHYRTYAFSIHFPEHFCALQNLSFLQSIRWTSLCTAVPKHSPFNFLKMSVHYRT